jgi:hypothetical protein
VPARRIAFYIVHSGVAWLTLDTRARASALASALASNRASANVRAKDLARIADRFIHKNTTDEPTNLDDIPQ